MFQLDFELAQLQKKPTDQDGLMENFVQELQRTIGKLELEKSELQVHLVYWKLQWWSPTFAFDTQVAKMYSDIDWLVKLCTHVHTSSLCYILVLIGEMTWINGSKLLECCSLLHLWVTTRVKGLIFLFCLNFSFILLLLLVVLSCQACSTASFLQTKVTSGGFFLLTRCSWFFETKW